MEHEPDTPWHLHSILMLFSMICQKEKKKREKNTSDIREYKAQWTSVKKKYKNTKHNPKRTWNWKKGGRK